MWKGQRVPLIPAVTAQPVGEQDAASETVTPGFHKLVNKQGIFCIYP